SEISVPIQTQLVEIKSDKAVLMVKIVLKEYRAEGINE
ncbi:pilus assembly protein PilO, partial [Yersinia enterocolitica]|nr:pilus assembly protein PilO [Yersinia enterocolitica]